MKWIYFGLFFLLFLSSNISMVSIVAGNANIIYFSANIMLIFLIVLKQKINVKASNIAILFFVTILMSISFWLNPFSEKFSFILRLVSILFLNMSCINSIVTDKEEYIRMVLYTAYASTLPLMLLNFISYLSTGNSQGIFANSNGFGLFASTTFLLSLLIIGISKKTYMFFISIFSLIFSFYFTVISNSRTSFLILMFGVFVYILALLYSGKFKKKHMIRYSPFILGMFFLVINFNDLLKFIQENILDKFQRKSNSGDVLDNRSSIWEGVIGDSSFWGHGKNYFINNFGFTAHNSYIDILGNYGYLVFFISIIFTLMMFYKFLVLFVKAKKIIYFIPILFLISFLLHSMTENVLFKMDMTLVFMLIPIVLPKTSQYPIK